MRSSSILWHIRDNFVVLVLGAVSFLLVALPLIRTSFEGVFYIVDPDAVYAGNAIAYAKVGQIFYIDHPGTPAIRYLAGVLVPIRIIYKLIKGHSFVTFALSHYEFIFTYLRLAQTLIFSASIAVFLYGVKKISGSAVAAIFAWTYLFSFPALPYFGLSISAEAMNLFLLSLWTIAFGVFYVARSPFMLLFLSFFAGLAMANRLTNVFLVVTSLILVFYLVVSFRYKVRNLLFSLMVVGLGFVFGSWPIRSKYNILFDWILRLATSSKVHGGGSRTMFDPSDYATSIRIVFESNKEILLIGIAGFAIALYVAILKKRLDVSGMLIALGILGLVVFSKYPLLHYQTANMILILLGLVILIRQYFGRYVYVLLTLVLVATSLPKSINSYYSNIGAAIEESRTIDKEAKTHASSIADIWEWSVSRDFALLWGDSWTGHSYQPELGSVRPNLYQIGGDMQTYRGHDGVVRPLASLCWQNLYIQTSELERFIEINKIDGFRVKKIEGTRMSLVSSDRCSTKP